MPSEIHVHLLPDHFVPAAVQGGTVIVVDVLRASTTILAALHNGAVEVRPCLTTDDARRHRSSRSDVLLGGERGGKKIADFDLGNSPLDYTPDIVGGRSIAFTTTNGTRALLMSRQADNVLIGTFANLSRLTNHLTDDERPLHIVCAGTNGEITGEDVLFAGCLAERLANDHAGDLHLSDAASIAMGYWRSATSGVGVEHALRQCHGGRNLMELGYDADIAFAATFDSASLIARYDHDSATIGRLA